jgi:hypothetical protein
VARSSDAVFLPEADHPNRYSWSNTEFCLDHGCASRGKRSQVAVWQKIHGYA